MIVNRYFVLIKPCFKFFFLLLLFAVGQIVNQHLLKDLTERGLWNEDLKLKLIAHSGSIQVSVG